MKRALSLIIVLAMVLCMIPFSAFAADFDTATDFVDGVITLPADEEVSYLWTATEDGTLYIYAEAVIPEVAEGEEAPAVAEPYILVDGAAYDAEAGVAVVAGQPYEITFGDDALTGGDVTVYTVFKGLPGTESNPYEYYNPNSGEAPEDQAATTVSVEPGASVYYNLWYYNATTLRISGVGVKAVKVWEDNTIDGTEVGYVDFEIASMERVVLIKITNKADTAQTYTFEGIVPSGTMNNPEVVTTGEYSVDIAENGEYWYQYVATADGKLSIGVAATTTVTDEEGNESVVDCWQYTVNPMSGGETHYCDDEVIVNPETIDVVAGDEVVFVVSTYSSTSRPAATVKTTVSFEEAVDGPIVIESLPYEVTHSGVYEQAYTYTATEAGYLYVATTGWVEMNVAGTMNYAEGYGDGYVLAMNEGDVANINLYAYWGEETFTYNFSWMTEITPDGSYGFPFVAEIPADGTVVTLANDGDEAVYYVYTATEDCKIYNAFMESTTDVAAGESLMIYVAPGGIQVNYVLPVATYGGVNYYDLQEAISAAAAVATDTNKQTVMMNTSYVNETQTLIIEPNVILDTQSKSITVKYIIGLSGSSLANTATRYNGSNLALSGQINVAKNCMILSETTVKATSSSSFMAVAYWLPDDNCYAIANLRMNDSAITKEFNTEALGGDGVKLGNFYHQTPGGISTMFQNNGSEYYGIRMVLRTEWVAETGAYACDYTYNTDFVKQVSSLTYTYTYTLTGLEEVLAVDMSTFSATPMIITDCGAVIFGNTIYYSAE